jgi:hypothetical protein
MKTLTRVLLAFILSIPVLSYSQIGPPAPSPGIWAIIDTNYNVGTANQGYTTAKITLKNTTVSKITGTQFRVFYDNTAFSSATVSLIGNPPNLYLQQVNNAANGYVTITLVYTGNSALYTIPDGETFEITLNHVTPTSTFLNLGAIAPLTFSGTPSFSQVAAEQPGNDIALSLHSYGGNFIKPGINFHGTFTNVNSTPSKSLTLGLYKKPKVNGSWSLVTSAVTNTLGQYQFQQPIDTTFYDVRLEVRGDTLGVGNVITSADAQMINNWVVGTATPQAFDFYAADVNGTNDITISDAYGVFGRVAGRFSVWPNNVLDVKFFTPTEYTTIVNNPTVNQSATITGVTNFTYDILPGQPDSANFYVLVVGDANQTGYHMARVKPVTISNPANAYLNVIDEAVEYDVNLPWVEVNLPTLSVNEGNLVEIPVKVLTNGYKLGALQLALKYDGNLLMFKGLNNSDKVMNWMSFINPLDSVVEWGGYDATGGSKLITDGETAFTLTFIAKTPQDDWGKSPLYTSRKFVGDEAAKDMNISYTNGVAEIKRIGPGVVIKDEEILVFPNPTTGEVIIQFNNAIDDDVTLSFVDINGKEVINVLNKRLPNGTYSYTANLKDLNNGIYYTVFKTTLKTVTNKTILIK